MPWGISEDATEKEKLKSEFADHINGLNCAGKLSYETYSELFDRGMRWLDEMYDLGVKDGAQYREAKDGR